jgi:hypothetical protein
MNEDLFTDFFAKQAESEQFYGPGILGTPFARLSPTPSFLASSASLDPLQGCKDLRNKCVSENPHTCQQEFLRTSPVVGSNSIGSWFLLNLLWHR